MNKQHTYSNSVGHTLYISTFESDEGTDPYIKLLIPLSKEPLIYFMLHVKLSANGRNISLYVQFNTARKGALNKMITDHTIAIAYLCQPSP